MLRLPTTARTSPATLPRQPISADCSNRAVQPLLASNDRYNHCGDVSNHVHSRCPPLTFRPPLLLPHRRDTVLPQLHYFTASIVQRTQKKTSNAWIQRKKPPLREFWGFVCCVILFSTLFFLVCWLIGLGCWFMTPFCQFAAFFSSLMKFIVSKVL